MWFNSSPTKVQRHFLTMMLILLPSYVYNMHLDTKSTRLTAVCKRSFTVYFENSRLSSFELIEILITIHFSSSNPVCPKDGTNLKKEEVSNKAMHKLYQQILYFLPNCWNIRKYKAKNDTDMPRVFNSFLCVRTRVRTITIIIISSPQSPVFLSAVWLVERLVQHGLGLRLGQG